jgi:hypothetical protein
VSQHQTLELNLELGVYFFVQERLSEIFFLRGGGRLAKYLQQKKKVVDESIKSDERLVAGA